MAAILGMDIPEEAMIAREMITVEPHEIVLVDNPNLPPLHDIERRQLQAEKQLEEVIAFSLGYQRTMFSEVSTIEPKYRSRYIEVANGTLSLALEAIRTKLKTQDDRRKRRLEEAEFQGGGGQGSGTGTNNFFFGSREDLITILKDTKVIEES